MITRILSPEMQTAIAQNPDRLVAYIEVNLDTVLRVHTGLGARMLEGNEYFGLGELAKIGAIKENSDQSANRLSLELKILDPALLSASLNEDLTGIEVFIHLVALNEKRKLSAAQMFFYEGEVSNKQIVEGDLSKQIPYLLQITVSDWYERWSRPANAARQTDAAQQFIHPGDRFFDQVEVLASAPIADIPIKGSVIGNGGGGRYGRNGPGNIKYLDP